jgi:hypothetical protein
MLFIKAIDMPDEERLENRYLPSAIQTFYAIFAFAYAIFAPN